MNLVDRVHAAIGRSPGGAQAVVSMLHHPNPRGDVAVFLRGGAAPRRTEAAGSPLAALRADEAIAAVRLRGNRGLLRFEDDRVAALGGELEAGGDGSLRPPRPPAGAEYVVDFCDPNATKALHVGHLRSIALGNGLASALEAIGAPVVRQSQIGDCGRSMGEALAGYLGEDGEPAPRPGGVKGDHLVGRAYARYVAELQARTAGPAQSGELALSREDHDLDDRANRLLRGLLDGEPAPRAAWLALRELAVEGQNATLARLGVSIDRQLFESDHLGACEAIVEWGLRRGALVREPGGAVRYMTGEDGYPSMLLQRADGIPTQHLRYIAVWHALGERLGQARTVQFVGAEWRMAMPHTEAILARLDPGRTVHPNRYVSHEMVTVEEETAKSSLGGSLLVDEMLDGLAETAARRRLAAPPRAPAEALAAIVALAFFLLRRPGQLVDVDGGALADEERNGGWAMARAWAHAWDPAFDGEPDPDHGDAEYRFLAVQSQFQPRLARNAVERLDTNSLARFYEHLSRWYLEREPRPRLARAMRTVLGSGLLALGLIDRERAAAPRAAAGSPAGPAPR